MVATPRADSPPPEPLSLADRLEIQDLIARYCWALDMRDGDAYAATFTPDGVFEGIGSRGRGHNELRALPLSLHPEAIETQHWVTNTVLQGDGQRATSKSYILILRAESYYLGHYADELAKVDGRWLFARRQFRRWPAGLEDAPNSLGGSP